MDHCLGSLDCHELHLIRIGCGLHLALVGWHLHWRLQLRESAVTIDMQAQNGSQRRLDLRRRHAELFWWKGCTEYVSRYKAICSDG
jgi:hypothetical protein